MSFNTKAIILLNIICQSIILESMSILPKRMKGKE